MVLVAKRHPGVRQKTIHGLLHPSDTPDPACCARLSQRVMTNNPDQRHPWLTAASTFGFPGVWCGHPPSSVRRWKNFQDHFDLSRRRSW